MCRTITSQLLFCALVLCAPALFGPQSASAVTIPWVPVGNPGNANDPATGNLYGGVAYNYNIDKYDVTDLRQCRRNANHRTPFENLALALHVLGPLRIRAVENGFARRGSQVIDLVLALKGALAGGGFKHDAAERKDVRTLIDFLDSAPSLFG